MKIAVFDTHRFERESFERANQSYDFDVTYFDSRLSEETVRLVFGFDVVCAFVNDCLDDEVIQALNVANVRLVALRSSGFNNVDLVAAEKFGIRVVRVPEYSPYAVAEHAMGLILCLDRKIHRAHQRVREGNFSLDGLVGFDLHGKSVGVIGTGRIGSVLVKILTGFGCKVLAYDLIRNEEITRLPGVEYVVLDRLYREADIISLHVPLNPETRHILNASAFSKMKTGVMIINTGRGALIDTHALIEALKEGKVGFAGLDVYEEEEKIFFKDLSDTVLQDDVIARLLTFPNVLVTSHQAFLTHEALTRIARTTFQNIEEFRRGVPLVNEVKPDAVIHTVARLKGTEAA